MSSSHGSSKVIIIAFFSNLGIAIAKFIGAFISGSASLMAEAIHSLVDCSNQILLLIGSKKSAKAADAKHPLGYGREAFFWSFIVAILLFSLGGLFAIYEGFHKLHESGNEVASPILGFVILLISILIESFSFTACLKEVRENNPFKNLWQWFKGTSNSELLVIFTEDLAALVGLTVAFVFLTISWVTANPAWDAIGSIVVGVLLVVVAVLLAAEVKSFIIGEAPASDLQESLNQCVKELFPGGKILAYIAIQTGSNEIMMSCKIHPGKINEVSNAIELVNKLEKENKAKYPELKWQFIELDYE